MYQTSRGGSREVEADVTPYALCIHCVPIRLHLPAATRATSALTFSGFFVTARVVIDVRIDNFARICSPGRHSSAALTTKETAETHNFVPA